MKKKIRFKTLKLLPTFQVLDVWLCNNSVDLAECFVKRYGASLEYYKRELHKSRMYSGTVRQITGTQKSEIKGNQHIVCIINVFRRGIIAHEIIHILFYLNEDTGVQINTTADEWSAYMMEYLIDEISDLKTYKEYDISHNSRK
jgi:hypothetical protein